MRKERQLKRETKKETKVKPVVLDGFGLCTKGERKDYVFIYDYKASQKFVFKSLKLILDKENLFLKVMRRIERRK